MAPRRRGEGGIALITVVFILALMSTFSVYLVEANHLAIRRIANQQNLELAHQLAIAGEQLAIYAIEHDPSPPNTRVDFYGEPWSISLRSQNSAELGRIRDAPEPLALNEKLGDGTISVLIEDATARFNINNLAIPRGPLPKPGGPPEQLRSLPFVAFVNLLSQIGVTSPEAFAENVVAWIDADSEEGGAGAEDNAYTALEMPYRTANAPINDINELRLVEGFSELTAEQQNKLLSLISTLPVGSAVSGFVPVRINVNTAPAELIALMLDSDARPVGIETGKQFVAARTKNNRPMSKFDPFYVNPPLQLLMTLEDPQDPKSANEQLAWGAMFDFKSDFYTATITVNVGGTAYQLVSLLRRFDAAPPNAGTSVGVIKRTRRLPEST